MTVLFGSSGHAKEIEYFLRLINRSAQPIVDYFISKENQNSFRGIPFITEDEFEVKLADRNLRVTAYIGIGSNLVREKIARKFSLYSNLVFPNIVAENTIGDLVNIETGDGNILFPSVILTTDITIGSHNHFNLNTSISHDCKIGNYNTFSPGTMIAGNVNIGNNNFFGLGSKVIEKIRIRHNVILGAGSVVINDISEPGTYVGIPAKRVNHH